ncbi:hypothetical protein [Streptomyces parvulus]|uniref:hypothetical protein n=1 Tax=Streptomyces parvulus TaxID=146923 RepID=UPI00369C30BA
MGIAPGADGGADADGVGTPRVGWSGTGLGACEASRGGPGAGVVAGGGSAGAGASGAVGRVGGAGAAPCSGSAIRAAAAAVAAAPAAARSRRRRDAVRRIAS